MATKKKYLSANEFLHDSWRLAAGVKASGWKPDILIALWRGGAAVGVSLHEFFKSSGWNVQHIPLKCASYTGIGENAGDVVFTLGDEIFGLLRRGDRVLVVDDVFDTGKTAKAVKARIHQFNGIPEAYPGYWRSGELFYLVATGLKYNTEIFCQILAYAIRTGKKYYNLREIEKAIGLRGV